MSENENNIKTFAWLAGVLFFVLSWLVGALAEDLAGSLNPWTVMLLCLTSICWGVYGWHAAHHADTSYEIRAFLSVIAATAPWLAFLIVMIGPYALGVRQGLP
jgi:hypothetical protein